MNILPIDTGIKRTELENILVFLKKKSPAATSIYIIFFSKEKRFYYFVNCKFN